jgi:hypothetical protein
VMAHEDRSAMPGRGGSARHEKKPFPHAQRTVPDRDARPRSPGPCGEPTRGCRCSPLGRGSTAPIPWFACGLSSVTGGSIFPRWQKMRFGESHIDEPLAGTGRDAGRPAGGVPGRLPLGLLQAVLGNASIN